MTRTTRTRLLAPLLLAAAACAHHRGPGLSDPGQEAMRHRAALATLTVDNRTDRRLQIAFRPAASAGGIIVVGEVGPASSAIMAPIPAGEPVILVALDGTEGRLDLEPRSFDVDARWTWLIPADAAFRPIQEGKSP